MKTFVAYTLLLSISIAWSSEVLVQLEPQIPDNDEFYRENWKKGMDRFSGETLKVIILTSPPETEKIGYLLELSNGTPVHLDGSSVQMLWILRDFLNIVLDIHLTKDWDVAWNAVAAGNVDLGAPLRTIQYHLTVQGALRNVTILHPMSSMPSVIYFREPPVTSFNHVIFGPFRANTWNVLLLTWLASVTICYSIHQYYGPSKNLRSDILLWATAMISGRDHPVNENCSGKLSLRIAMLSAMCLTTIALAVYTGKIVAYFSMKNTVIKSPEELLRYGYTLSSFSHVHIDRIFQTSKNKRQLMKTSLHNFKSGQDSTFKLVAPGNPDPRYAFLSHPDGFYIYGRFYNNYSKELCGISSFSSTIKSPRAMYLKKGSPFREILNWKILQAIERGVNHRHQISHAKKYQYMCCTRKESFEELSLNHTLFPFAVLVTGAILALVIEIAVVYTKVCKLLGCSGESGQDWHKLERSESTLEYGISNT